jgi:hypothetical protein
MKRDPRLAEAIRKRFNFYKQPSKYCQLFTPRRSRRSFDRAILDLVPKDDDGVPHRLEKCRALSIGRQVACAGFIELATCRC